MDEEKLVLSGADVFYSKNPRDAYLVESGEVLVYIMPWNGEKPGRRLLLGQVEPKRMIPSLYFCDANYRYWSFALVARESAVLRVRKDCVTSVLQKNFAQRMGVPNFEQEGFFASLVDYYERENLKDHAFIAREKRSAPAARQESFGAIRNALKEEDVRVIRENASYAALEYACRTMKIGLLRPEELAARCGKNATVPQIAEASRFLCRSVVLEPNWFRDDCGTIIGTIDDSPVSCVPTGLSGYRIFYAASGKTARLTPQIAAKISPKAYCIGRSLPAKSLSKKDVVHFCMGSIRKEDILSLAVIGLVCALIGILLPNLNQKIYDDYIPLGNFSQLAQVCFVTATFMLGNMLFSVVKNLAGLRMTGRMSYDLQNAVYYRLFHLPESFFRDYDSADLAKRIVTIPQIVAAHANAVIVTGIASVFSVIYLVRMWRYSGKMTWIGMGMFLVYAGLLTAISLAAVQYEAKAAKSDGEASAKLYQYLSGIDKIRMAGVEDQATLSYLQPFAGVQTAAIRKNRIVSAAEVLTGLSSTVFSMILYLVIVKSKLQLSVGSFMGFNAAFGVFTGILQSLLTGLLDLVRQKELIRRAMPLFAEKPEDDNRKELPGVLRGAISFEHVSFSYRQGGQKVLSDISLDIRPGEYVGIVGSSGCGKSTLLKLMLGFEAPDSGMVLFDGKDLGNMDKSAFRKQLGVVLQNGKLISGSIYDNITITAPKATMAQVNEVIEAVGLKADIGKMPMGIHTVLSETANTISGGQQQRILIARAIINKPAILLFDEATSALDNITQAEVCASLDKMKSTRIVVAHRLSTIKNCDRILVMDGGTIAEEGSYETLMARRGLFYRLASRQIAQKEGI